MVKLEPKYKTAWNNLGRAYMALGQEEKAVAAFQKQIEINPYDEYAYSSLGLAYQRQQAMTTPSSSSKSRSSSTRSTRTHTPISAAST